MRGGAWLAAGGSDGQALRDRGAFDMAALLFRVCAPPGRRGAVASPPVPRLLVRFNRRDLVAARLSAASRRSEQVQSFIDSVPVSR